MRRAFLCWANKVHSVVLLLIIMLPTLGNATTVSNPTDSIGEAAGLSLIQEPIDEPLNSELKLNAGLVIDLTAPNKVVSVESQSYERFSKANQQLDRQVISSSAVPGFIMASLHDVGILENDFVFDFGSLQGGVTCCNYTDVSSGNIRSGTFPPETFLPEALRPETFQTDTFQANRLNHFLSLGFPNLHPPRYVDTRAEVTATDSLGYVALMASGAALMFIVSRNIRRRNRSQHHRSLPPVNAQFLFHLFLDTKDCDAMTGDLEERYKILHKRFGKGKADFWYWTQTLTSIGPIVWAATKRVMKRLIIPATSAAVAKGLLSDHSWLASVVEIWKKVGL